MQIFYICLAFLAAVAHSARVRFTSVNIPDREYLVNPSGRVQFHAVGSIVGTDQPVMMDCKNDASRPETYKFAQNFASAKAWMIDLAALGDMFCLVTLRLGPSLMDSRTAAGRKLWSWNVVGRVGMSLMNLVKEFRVAGYIHTNLTADTVYFGGRNEDDRERLYPAHLKALKPMPRDGRVPTNDIKQVVVSLMYLRTGDKKFFAANKPLEKLAPLPADLPHVYQQLLAYVFTSGFSSSPMSLDRVTAMLGALANGESDETSEDGGVAEVEASIIDTAVFGAGAGSSAGSGVHRDSAYEPAIARFGATGPGAYTLYTGSESYRGAQATPTTGGSDDYRPPHMPEDWFHDNEGAEGADEPRVPDDWFHHSHDGGSAHEPQMPRDWFHDNQGADSYGEPQMPEDWSYLESESDSDSGRVVEPQGPPSRTRYAKGRQAPEAAPMDARSQVERAVTGAVVILIAGLLISAIRGSF